MQRLIQSRLYHLDASVYGHRVSTPISLPDWTSDELKNQEQFANILRYIEAYRSEGHLTAKLDPLERQVIQLPKECQTDRYGIDLHSTALIPLKGLLSIPGKSEAPISEIQKHLEQTYSQFMGAEFQHIPDAAERGWWAQSLESIDYSLSMEQKYHLLALITESEVFDHFMQKRFTQVKRYGLEGAESMMIVMDGLFRLSAQASVVDAVLCMPHRGRLNLLVNLLKYDASALFHKVKGQSELPTGCLTGDVLSHLAQRVTLPYENGQQLDVTLLHNPSHLEAVNPVAMGVARAKELHHLQRHSCQVGDKVLCIQLHGDAAFTGQGVVQETLAMSQLPFFGVGGSIHLIVNNQIGYTTQPQNSRSTRYASDIGKMIHAPVLHVNGDQPEAVYQATRLAFQYRQLFRRDVILDLIAYRRWGHNEVDEPGFTQPLMYKKIRSHPSVAQLYAKSINAAVEKVQAIRDHHFQSLDVSLQQAAYKEYDTMQGRWKTLADATPALAKTAAPLQLLQRVGEQSVTIPKDFEIHTRLVKYHVQPRLKSLQNSNEKSLDWATAEALAMGSLLMEGHSIRLSGQDVGRGTFSQRHVMLVDQKTGLVHIPLNQLNPKAQIEVANSHLSEMGVLGFEYGVSWTCPLRLCIFEAQFGDFFNGAQIIIDTFISSGEPKWLRQSGLVLLLPHGFDGTGPEHSSCRLERFLQMVDEPIIWDKKNKTDAEPRVNMHVVHPTTPAQYFHLLRRQVKRPTFRRPLIVAAPKVLLRLPAAVSSLEELTDDTQFQAVLDDPNATSQSSVLVFVSGKVYYDLVKERSQRGLDSSVALIRIEEVAPFPFTEIESLLKKYTSVKKVIFFQEEHENMGTFAYIAPRLQSLLETKLHYVGREASAAPATGIAVQHKKEWQTLLDTLFQ